MIDRHMTSAPERGPVYLMYGCNRCHWSYWPRGVAEANQISWAAMVQYEKHDCAKHGTKVLLKPPLVYDGEQLRLRRFRMYGAYLDSVAVSD